MVNANQHPTNGSFRSSSAEADKEKGSSTLTQTEEIQRPNELFWEAAYKKEVARLSDENLRLHQENNQLRHEKFVLEFQNVQLMDGKQNGGFDDDSKMAFEADIARKRIDGVETPNHNSLEMISSLGKQQEGEHKEKHAHEIAQPESKLGDLEPIVIKKLKFFGCPNMWLGYLTMDEDEKPIVISIFNYDLIIDGYVSQKKLIIDGVLSQYECDPFRFHHIGHCGARCNVSHLLQKVHSCKITGFFLYSQILYWKEFEKLISSKTIKNLYMANNRIIDEKNNLVSIEKILEYAPNIENVAYYGNINKETFVNLSKLPVFTKLRVFKIGEFFYHDFDAESFLAFMKKYPDAHFYLESRVYVRSEYDKAEYRKMKLMLESSATPDQLHDDSF